MVKGLVSVVLPIYNVEAYLDRCMESVVSQSYKNIEIIMVDDGSSDSCPQKCEAWAERDSRIKVIHKVNAGLGMARNTGIENAAGEYICFFDSDDYVAPDTIEKALALARRDHSDLVLFGMNRVDAKGELRMVCCPSTEKTFYEGPEILDFVLPNAIEGSAKAGQNYNLNMSACTCLFSMKLIRESQWRFASEREFISEDYYSLLQLYARVRRVSVLKQACYFYCYNESSLTHVFRPDRFAQVCHCYSAMMEMAEELHYPKAIEASLSAQYFGNVIGAMKMIITASDLCFSDKIKGIRGIMKNETFRRALQRLDFASENPNRKLLICAIKTNCALAVFLLVMAKLQLSRQ